MIDYGVEYATIQGDGRLLLDLSPIRVEGPMVPVIRVCRAWLEVLSQWIEVTRPRDDFGELQAKLLAAGLAVDHVLAIDPVRCSLGLDKALRASGSCYVGGSKVYPLNVAISQLGAALVQVQQ